MCTSSLKPTNRGEIALMKRATERGGCNKNPKVKDDECSNEPFNLRYYNVHVIVSGLVIKQQTTWHMASKLCCHSF